ncbi:MAG: Methyltransferase type 11 [Frankiales bacterium]|nr:Methyltransferase type 11 [Frankiales bacterium]
MSRPLPDPAALPPLGSVARSAMLLRAFPLEQTDPAAFYSLLAADSVRQVAHYQPLAGLTLLDVGGGPGYFADAFRAAGARYVGLDADVGELSLHGRSVARDTVLGSGLQLPFRDGALDVCYSSNVLEHVPQPERMADEMVRVTAKGGLVFLSYNNWLAPNGGHETAPWHYLGGRYAADRYASRQGKRPKNEYGTSLFRTSVAQMLRWTRDRQRAGVVQVVDVRPRYHPDWARWVVAVPGLREVVTWNLALVLRVPL